MRGATVKRLRRLSPTSRSRWRSVKRAYTRLNVAERTQLRAQIAKERPHVR